MPAMPQIKETGLKIWTNRHETFKQPIDNLYDVTNGNSGNLLADYNATTKAIGQFIDAVTINRKQVRALGGGWSFTQVATCKDWMLDTKHLNFVFTINGSSVSPDYKGNKEQLLLAQCGNSVQELNNFLKARGRSLKTSGASNGQTIVGAFSTGTHGAAIDFGSTQDYIVGLHLVLGANNHIWLERATYPVASDSFIQKLGTRLVGNDALFNAAVMSFGSFGFIHGVMLETEPLYLLECYRQQLPYDDDLKHLMQTLDFSQAKLQPHGSERPFHFQVVVNPYDIKDGMYVTTMYKRPYTPNYQPWIRDFTKAGPGDDAPAFLGKMAATVPALTPAVVNQLVKITYAPFDNVWGTSGEIFYNTDARGKICSTAFGVPLSHVRQVHDLMMELNETVGPFAGVFAYRYVKKSEATLAFTPFSHTCVVEIDGAESGVSKKYYEAVWRELLNRNIPHAYHWGKMHNLNANTVQHLFGKKRGEWIAARNQLLTPDLMDTFCNDAIKTYGLDVKIGLPV